MIDFEDMHELPTEAPTFKCEKCRGSGKWVTTNSHGNSNCHKCSGRGFLVTDPAVLNRARQNRAKRKVTNERERMEALRAKASAFTREHEELVEFVAGNSSWSGFYASLMESLRTYGSWTDNQIASAQKAMNKSKEPKEERDVIEVDLTKIHSLFETAKASGLQRPALVLGGVRVSMAPENGANAGHLYVKRGDSYQGKLTPAGKFFKVRSADADIEPTLISIAADPKGAIRNIGMDTGVCCCCGRELTNKVSIEAGIGPVCATRWGL